jgi:hypothetical protein
MKLHVECWPRLQVNTVANLIAELFVRVQCEYVGIVAGS